MRDRIDVTEMGRKPLNVLGLATFGTGVTNTSVQLLYTWPVAYERLSNLATMSDNNTSDKKLSCC